MADYYFEMASSFPFPKAAADEFENIMETINRGLNGEEVEFPEWFDVSILDDVESSNVDMEYGNGHLYVHSDNSEDIYLVPQILSLVMKEYNVSEVIIIEGACTCSKPRDDGFGGTVAVAGPGYCKVRGTGELGQMMKEEAMRELGLNNSETPKM